MSVHNLVCCTNPSISMKSVNNEGVIVSLCGHIKVLKCDPSVLKQVLALADGRRSFVEVLEELAHNYPREDVDNFLRTLVQEEIIVHSEKNESINSKNLEKKGAKLSTDLSVALIGNGYLANAVKKKLDGEFKYSTRTYLTFDDNFQEMVSDSDLKERIKCQLELVLKKICPDFVVFCAERLTFGEMIAFNDACLLLNIPFLFCYYNGKYIILGPTVLPYKTPCYGCLLEHRRQSLVEKSVMELTINHLYSLTEAIPLPSNFFDQAILDWIASHIIREVRYLQQGGFSLSLIAKQVRISDDRINCFDEITFEPITTCPCCYGMSGRNLIYGYPEISALPSYVKVSLENKPVVYKNGGRRSVSVEEAIRIVNRAIERTGFEVNIKRLVDHPLDNILFRYTATIQGKYNARLPFYVHETIIQRGKGMTEEQAYLSAAFELFERLCARYYGDMEMIRASYKEVQDIAFDLKSYIVKTFHEGVMESFDENAPIDWVWAYSLVHKCPKLVPASLAFITGAKILGQFFDDSSSGLAAGATIEDAILQAILEIIEHDAWIIWQANAITLPEVRQDTISDHKIINVLEQLYNHGFRVIIRNYTTDFSIPVFRAWIVDPKNYRCYATNGFGANLDPGIALERSISEAWLARGISTIEEQRHYGGPSTREMVFSYYSLYSLYHFNRLEISNYSNKIDYSLFRDQSTNSVAEDIEKIISLIREQLPNVDVLVINLTKEVLEVPVVRVVVGGGLQRFAEPSLSISKRLFDLPVKFGYRQKSLTYEELYNGPFPH